MLFQLILSLLAARAQADEGKTLDARQNSTNSTSDVNIVRLVKNVTATSGTGDVSAAGNLNNFGNLGLGCGINWAEKESFGGGIQAGSSAFGLGGGFTIRENEMSIGLGMDVIPKKLQSSIKLDMGVNGTMRLVITSGANFTCSQLNEGGQAVTICTTK